MNHRLLGGEANECGMNLFGRITSLFPQNNNRRKDPYPPPPCYLCGRKVATGFRMLYRWHYGDGTRGGEGGSIFGWFCGRCLQTFRSRVAELEQCMDILHDIKLELKRGGRKPNDIRLAEHFVRDLGRAAGSENLSLGCGYRSEIGRVDHQNRGPGNPLGDHEDQTGRDTFWG